MTRYNSSKYRVEPTAKVLNSTENVNKLLSLVCNETVEETGEIFYGKNEKKLKPKREHLLKIIDHVCENAYKSSNTNTERIAFVKSNKYKAKELIEKNYDTLPSKAWYILEGRSCPDLYIECKNHIILCEGKWTESNITTKTTYLPNRNQMARHIQGALNETSKKIIAFYIVDANCAYTSKLTNEVFKSQLENESIALEEIEKQQILSSFYGYTTWQEINKAFPQITFLTKNEIDNQK
jgi:hypothetical protein